MDVPDAIEWLNTCATRAIGADPGIDRFPIAATYGEPKVLVAENSEGQRFLLSVHSPDDIHRIRNPRRWPWSSSRFIHRDGNLHPLIPLTHQIKIYNISKLNWDPDFISKAAQVWKRLTGEKLYKNGFWLYVLPYPQKKE